MLLLFTIFAAQSFEIKALADAMHSKTPIASGPDLLITVKQLNFRVENIRTTPGAYVPVRITLPSAKEFQSETTEGGAFILIRNIPQAVSLSAGLPSGRVWVVPLTKVKELSLTSAPDIIGDFRLEFYLIGPGNRVLAQQNVSLAIQQPTSTRQTSTLSDRNALPTEQNRPLEQDTPAISAEEETILLKRGEEVLQQGGVAAARIIFEELATRGSYKGAFALAQTYDPAFFKYIPGSGISPDVEEALKWYDRAADLGSTEAKERRATLAAGG